MKNYTLTNIVWDTEGEQVNLPTTMTVFTEDESEAIEVASDKTGWCILSADVEETKVKASRGL